MALLNTDDRPPDPPDPPEWVIDRTPPDPQDEEAIDSTNANDGTAQRSTTPNTNLETHPNNASNASSPWTMGSLLDQFLQAPQGQRPNNSAPSQLVTLDEKPTADTALLSSSTLSDHSHSSKLAGILDSTVGLQDVEAALALIAEQRRPLQDNNTQQQQIAPSSLPAVSNVAPRNIAFGHADPTTCQLVSPPVAIQTQKTPATIGPAPVTVMTIPVGQAVFCRDQACTSISGVASVPAPARPFHVVLTKSQAPIEAALTESAMWLASPNPLSPTETEPQPASNPSTAPNCGREKDRRSKRNKLEFNNLPVNRDACMAFHDSAFMALACHEWETGTDSHPLECEVTTPSLKELWGDLFCGIQKGKTSTGMAATEAFPILKDPACINKGIECHWSIFKQCCPLANHAVPNSCVNSTVFSNDHRNCQEASAATSTSTEAGSCKPTFPLATSSVCCHSPLAHSLVWCLP